MMRFTDPEKKMLFAFGSIDPEETAARLCAMSAMAVSPDAKTALLSLSDRISGVGNLDTMESYHQAYHHLCIEQEIDLLAPVWRVDHKCEVAMDYPILDLARSQLVAAFADYDDERTRSRLKTLLKNLTEIHLASAMESVLDELNTIRTCDPFSYNDYIASHKNLAAIVNDPGDKNLPRQH